MILINKDFKVEQEKDLCNTCKHYWTDFPMPLDHYEPHCEIIDKNMVMAQKNLLN